MKLLVTHRFIRSMEKHIALSPIPLDFVKLAEHRPEYLVACGVLVSEFSSWETRGVQLHPPAGDGTPLICWRWAIDEPGKSAGSSGNKETFR